MTNVIFVCLGNICRSPAAEALFKQMCQGKGTLSKFDITSRAITSWNIGDPASLPMREAALERGVTIDTKSTLLTYEEMKKADYILAATEEIASHLREKAPELTSKIHLITAWSSQFEGEDIPDPYRLEGAAQDRVLDMLEDSLSQLYNKLNVDS